MSGGGLSIGIDASRNRSGGAIAHLVGILAEVDPAAHGIREMHVWAYRALLDRLPERPWLRKHAPPELERSLVWQLRWQARALGPALDRAGCDVLYTTDASTLCPWRPQVVFSQDLLSYEPGLLRDLGPSYAALRALGIRYVQNSAFRRADGVVFLTQHAGERIMRSCGPLSRVAYIPHGVNDAFRAPGTLAPWPAGDGPVRCVYVSPVLGYKHQPEVVRAVALGRERGLDLALTLVGTGDAASEARLEQQIRESDPAGAFVARAGHVPVERLPALLAAHHLYVFASTSESFGITLLEGMAMGLPIVCSRASSLPETLEDGGVYCDPLDPASIADGIGSLVRDPSLRRRVAARAESLSRRYSWRRCATETFDFIVKSAPSRSPAP